MANRLKMKQSSVAGKVPATTDLLLGELAVNTTDGKLYLKKNVSGTETIVDVTAGGLLPASATNLGGVKGLTNLTIDAAGNLSLSGANVNAALGYTADKPSLLDGMKNFLINSQFQIWQNRANRSVVSPSTNSYILDGWIAVNPAGVQYSLDGNGTYLIWQATVANTYGQLHQPIETYLVRRMAGKQVTFSFEWGGLPEFVGSLTYEIYYSATSDAWSNTWLSVSGATGVTTAGVENTYRTSVTFTVPSNAVGLRVGIVPTNVQPITAAVGISKPQLELGPTRTAFENRDITLDLLMCQRYYEKSYDFLTAPGTAIGNWNGAFWHAAINGGDFYSLGGFRFKTQKRIAPNVTLYDPYYGTAGAMSSPQDYAQTTAAVTVAGQDGVSNVRCPSNNMTTNRIYCYHYVADARL